MATAPWFIAPRDEWRDDEVVLPPDESHHATKVLRVAPPDVITVTDGRGLVARCAAERIEDGRLVAEVLEREERRRLRPEVVVYQGAAKGHKVDEIVERLAEMGISELWAYESGRTVARWDAAKVDKLSERWRSIAEAAAKQSRNPFVLTAGAGLSWTELVRRVAAEDFAVVLWEGATLPLRTALVGRPERIALIVGPEGGFDRDEADEMADSGGQLVSLGPHILRTEVAPMVACSAILYHYGLIG